MAVVPGALMLAAIGLERLESGLCDEALTTTDTVDVLRQTQADDMLTAGRGAAPEALTGAAQRRAAVADERIRTVHRLYRHSGANPQFHATHHANRV